MSWLHKYNKPPFKYLVVTKIIYEFQKKIEVDNVTKIVDAKYCKLSIRYMNWTMCKS
jgi:hypothetical protein